MVLIIGDSILWNSKTRSLTPIEVMTSFEGEYAINVGCSNLEKEKIAHDSRAYFQPTGVADSSSRPVTYRLIGLLWEFEIHLKNSVLKLLE